MFAYDSLYFHEKCVEMKQTESIRQKKTIAKYKKM